MDVKSSLTENKNDVMRKIGRNILNFQKIEGLLKFLIANSSFSGFASDIKQNKQQKVESINKQTMGQLVGQFLDNLSADTNIDTPRDDEMKEPHLSFKFNIGNDGLFMRLKNNRYPYW